MIEWWVLLLAVGAAAFGGGLLGVVCAWWSQRHLWKESQERQHGFEEMREQVEREIAESRKRMTH